MKFDKVLLRRYYDSGVKYGCLIPHVHNDYIFDNVYGDKARSLLSNALKHPDKIPVKGNRKALVVGIIASGEIMDFDEIKNYMTSYGITKIEFTKNKRISIKSKDGKLILENIGEVMKNKSNYDYIDKLLDETKVKYVHSKEAFLCKNGNKKEFKKLVLKADVRCQIIKEEYLDIFPPTPDQDNF